MRQCSSKRVKRILGEHFIGPADRDKRETSFPLALKCSPSTEFRSNWAQLRQLREQPSARISSFLLFPMEKKKKKGKRFRVQYARESTTFSHASFTAAQMFWCFRSPDEKTKKKEDFPSCASRHAFSPTFSHAFLWHIARTRLFRSASAMKVYVQNLKH